MDDTAAKYTEKGQEAPGETVELGGQPEQNKRVSKSWFWIALLSLINLYYILGATPQYFVEESGIEFGTNMVYAIGLIVATACMIIIPLIFRRLGVFDSPSMFKSVFCTLSGAGVILMIFFAVICNIFYPAAAFPILVLQYVIVAIPAIITGLALHRAIRVMYIKSAALISGLIFIFVLVLSTIQMGFILITESWRFWQVSTIIIHAALFIIPVVLLVRNKDDFESAAPKSAEYFSDSLFRKFMILAVIMATMDSFYDSSYYAGGSYASYSFLFSFLVTILPAVFAVVMLIMLRRDKWLPIMLASTLFICFQQGLILFFNDNETLAVVYGLFDIITESGRVIFFLFIPLIFCLQRRKNATAVIVLLSIWFFETALTYFISIVPDANVSFMVAPAVNFTLSIATIAFLFYLYSEHNRLYIKTLIEDFKSKLGDGSLPTNEAMTDAGFTQEEIKVAMLLIEGNTRSDILRKLHISAAEAGQHENAIRKKMLAMGDPDHAIAAIVTEYKLTKRETDMLRYLRGGVTNAAMAEELFLSEETVKIHVRNLMKKLPVGSRTEVAEWIESYSET